MPFATVLLIAGLLFLAVGLFGKVKIKDYDFGTDSVPIRIAACILGMLLLAAAYFVYQSDKLPTPDNSNTSIRPIASLVPDHPVTPTPLPSPTGTPVNPNRLIDIIKKAQSEKVKESYGELAGQNFSDRDLANFIKSGSTADIKDRLKTDAEFLEIVLAIKGMTMTDRQKLLAKAASTYKLTWVELGRVDSAGQTDAGQRAERMIADAIVNLVKELSSLPDENIKKLQNE